ncbi:HAMP domain-containing sensor histidine kinase [Emergencia sp. 1XD21-10]|uniref:sensor histidine kinase n=1 Tax=Emergencia sp. 1XD21-10 TaxID=2304569 RepID=UPI0027D2B0CE|nr:ATP-binding protein [Emergencia sp. 1XD21-10]
MSDMIEYYTLWAHQIKTPIAAMDLLLQSEMPGVCRDQLVMELFKVEQYVEMVLQYLRLGADSTDFRIERQEIDKIIREVVKKYSTIFIKKKISLDYQGVDAKTISDEKWLSFVLEQVLSNALKYTPSGKISIYMDKVLPCTLVIEDTGIGIQEEDLPRIFDKGYTGYTGRKDKKSTGIGLYLCRMIMNKLGHTMTIESQVGKGTKVKLGLGTYENVRFE